jgi:tryptophan synthase alpha chain
MAEPSPPRPAAAPDPASPKPHAGPVVAGPVVQPPVVAPPAPFFAGGADGRTGGLALFLNAGDPPLAVASDLVRMLDEAGVDCLELAVPFPNSVTDGPAIRRSAARALDGGVDLDDVLAFVAAARPTLRHLRIAMLVDWAHTIRPRTLGGVVRRAADAGADGLLVHALPPRLRTAYHDATAAAGLPIVTTCYACSGPGVLAEAAAHASAYLYLVAHYGRSGSAPPGGYDGLAATVADLRARAAAPVAVGFGIRTAADVARVHGLGADAAVVGTAAVARVEQALAGGRDVVADLDELVRSLQPARVPS